MKHVYFFLITIFSSLSVGAASAQVIITNPQPVESQPLPPLMNFKNNPELFRMDSYLLRIPFVDHAGIPGQYQDVTVEYLPQNRAWRLSAYRKAVPVQDITAVDVIVTEELPAQVFLDITGTLNNGCLELGQVAINEANDEFTVYLYYQPFLPDCTGTADVRPFRKVVPLDVYGLPARTYAYDVNGKFTGTFTLGAHNVLE